MSSFGLGGIEAGKTNPGVGKALKGRHWRKKGNFQLAQKQRKGAQLSQ